MQLALSIHTNSSAEIDRLDGLIESLKQVRVEARQGVDFNQLEAEVGRIFNQAQRGILTSLLEEYDINVPSFEHQENTYRQASRSTKRYMTAAGEILAQRSLYRDRRNGETYCPMELHSGIIEGFWTPKAAKQAIHMVSLITPVEAHRLFEELGAMCPSSSSLTRLPSKLNATIEVKPEDLQEKLKEQFIVPQDAATVSVSLDGVMVPTRDKVLPGDTKWGEASCGTISFTDINGELISTQYVARMPESKKRSLKTHLAQSLELIMEKRPDLSIIKIADGARDNWTFLEGEISEGESVLDYYHASGHLFEALEFIYGVSSDKAYEQHKKYRRILRDDAKGITKVINHLKYKAKGKGKGKGKNAVKKIEELTREINYFKNNKHRCNYAKLKAENKPIGSGIVESACKTVVQLRCKRAGQRWEHKGGQAILRFRALLLSNQFDTAWDFIASTYKNTEIKWLELPDNVVPFRKI
jgi:hypothetical protein